MAYFLSDRVTTQMGTYESWVFFIDTEIVFLESLLKTRVSDCCKLVSGVNISIECEVKFIDVKFDRSLWSKSS